MSVLLSSLPVGARFRFVGEASLWVVHDIEHRLSTSGLDSGP
jgi:hypothetical protein